MSRRPEAIDLAKQRRALEITQRVVLEKEPHLSPARIGVTVEIAEGGTGDVHVAGWIDVDSVRCLERWTAHLSQPDRMAGCIEFGDEEIATAGRSRMMIFLEVPAPS